MRGRTLIPPGMRSITFSSFLPISSETCRSRCDLRLSDVNKLSPFCLGPLPKHFCRGLDYGVRRVS